MEDLKQKPFLKKTYDRLPDPLPKRTECDCNHPWCIVCHPENAKLGTAPDYPIGPPSAKALSAKTPKEKTKTPGLQIGGYRPLLGLEMTDIANIFDEVILHREIVEARVLKDRAPVEARFVELNKQIRELNRDSKTRTVKWQMAHRPDDISTPEELRWRRRQDTRELAAMKKEKREIQARLHGWEGNSCNYELVQQRKLVARKFEELYSITHREKKVDWGYYVDSDAPRDQNSCGPQDTYFGDVYDIAGYRALVANLPATKNWTAAGWVEWENLVILKAIEHEFIVVDDDIIEQHPALRGRALPSGVDEEDHDHELRLVKKTGGATWGGASVLSRGYRDGKLRQLESFDSTMPKGRGRGEPGATYDDDTTLSDDLETFNPD